MLGLGLGRYLTLDVTSLIEEESCHRAVVPVKLVRVEGQVVCAAWPGLAARHCAWYDERLHDG